MPKIRRVIIISNGTGSIQKKDMSNWITATLSFYMYHPNNFIVNLYENCEEENKYYFDGPGTDIFQEKERGNTISKLFWTMAGLMDGHVGITGIENNLIKAKQIIIEHAKLAEENNEALELFTFSYSRGCFFVWRLKQIIAQLIETQKIKIECLHLYNIDPVIGGPFDRLRLFYHSGKKDPAIKINSHTYYSDSGNLNIWPRFLPFNTIFFSGFSMDPQSHSESKEWRLKVNHEGIIGKYKNHSEKLAADIVSGHILERIKDFLNMNEDWMTKTIQEGRKSLEEYEKLNLTPKDNRAFLSAIRSRTCFIGEYRKINLQPLSFESKDKEQSHLRNIDNKKPNI